MPGISRVCAPVAMIRLSQVTVLVLPPLSFTSTACLPSWTPSRVPQPSISVILFFFIRKWTPLTMPAETWRLRLCVGP